LKMWGNGELGTGNGNREEKGVRSQEIGARN
jgi:hypothetical protein